MCIGEWSHLGYVKDSDLKAIAMEPEVAANGKEGDLVEGWDSIEVASSVIL